MQVTERELKVLEDFRRASEAERRAGEAAADEGGSRDSWASILAEEGVGALASSKQRRWLVEESLAHRIASREPPPPPPAG